MPRPTLADIAAELGLSTMTVSRALNGKPGVGAQTRRRVLEVAEQLGYQANWLAASLKASRTRTIGVCVHSLTSSSAAELLNGIDHVAREFGYHVFIGCAHDDHVTERDVINSFLRMNVEGLIVSPVSGEANGPLFAELLRRDVPMVFVERHLATAGMDYVATDNMYGGVLATQHLLELGHRNIAFVYGGSRDSLEVQDRFLGYQRALRAAGVGNDIVAYFEPPAPLDEENGYRATLELFGRRDDVTALFAVNDNVAIGALSALFKLGLGVPRDVSVVGFDDVAASTYSVPPLTTVRQDRESLGRLGVETLIATIGRSKAHTGKKTLVAPTLVARNSTGAVRQPYPLATCAGAGVVAESDIAKQASRGKMRMADFDGLKEAIINGDANKARELTKAALDGGTDPQAIVNEGMIPAMAVVGDRFKKGEFFVPEMLVAARAMYAGLDLVRPLLAGRKAATVGKVIIGTVKGDLHDIGKNLVKMMLEGGGFEVVDLGTDVTPDKFVEAVRKEQPTHLGMSALLTTTMPSMKDTIQALAAAGIRDQVKVIVGGAPVTQKYANEIGADGYAPDASSAVDLAKQLIGA